MPNNDPDWLKQHLEVMKAATEANERMLRDEADLQKQELADLREEYTLLVERHTRLLKRFAALNETPPGIHCSRCKGDKAELHEHCPCGSWCGTPGCNDRH